jgi:hypothetical protein
VDLHLGVLVNLEDLVGNQAVSPAMNRCSVLRRMGFHEAGDPAGLLVDPVAQDVAWPWHHRRDELDVCGSIDQGHVVTSPAPTRRPRCASGPSATA